MSLPVDNVLQATHVELSNYLRDYGIREDCVEKLQVLGTMEEQHSCSLCPYYYDTQQEFLHHINRRHKNAKNLIIHCDAIGCGTTFKKYELFRKHVSRHHQVPVEDEDASDNMDVDSEHEEQDESMPQHKQVEEATYLLRMKVDHRLTQTALDDLVVSTKDLFKSRLEPLKRELADQNISTDSVTSLPESLFDGLESAYQQDKFYTEHLGYIKPEPVKIGTEKVTKTRKGKQVVLDKDQFAYIVPFQDQLSSLLAQPEVKQELRRSTRKRDEWLKYDVQDGSYYQSHPMVLEHGEETLIFALYSDDFEIANPIGVNRTTHKLTAFYWVLLNIPPQHRSRLSCIQLLCLMKSSHMKTYGTGEALADFRQSMEALRDGLLLNVGGSQSIYHGFLLVVLGDTLAQQVLGGFKEGVGGAQKPCRNCEVDKGRMPESRSVYDFPLRDEREHRERVTRLGGDMTKKAREYWSRHYGINGLGHLYNIPGFSLTECILHDPMHVLLEGVWNLELGLMLRTFIEEEKFFTLKSLNDCITLYPYTVEEKKDKPHLVDKMQFNVGQVFRQTAKSMSILIKHLPFMIGGMVPEGNQHWMCFLLLLQITLLSLSYISSDRTPSTLMHLIAQHNSLFVRLYPDGPFTPKLHYLVHLPDQLKKFGPLRNQWCMRFEAKNGFFKTPRWHNFINIAKSLATYHQRYMCLQMYGTRKVGSDCFLGGDDIVGEGQSVPFDTVIGQDAICLLLRRHPRMDEMVLLASTLIHHGHTYRPGTVLVEKWERLSEPTFFYLHQIVVIEHEKFLVGYKLSIDSFKPHLNAFQVEASSELKVLSTKHLMFEWPQIYHNVDGRKHVMLQHVDDVWSL